MLQVDKRQKFDLLVENVTQCKLCKRMNGRQKVLSHRNGDINAKVLFIGEAPGRLGADRTLVPLYGDQTGRNFQRLLATAGLKRDEVFITNAVLCNPRNRNGNNAAPLREEIRNCSFYLSFVLDIVHPEMVVTLGHQALAALNEIVPHSLELRQHVGKAVMWYNYVVLPLYHPGPRALVHRSFGNQIKDFYIIGEILDRKTFTQRRRIGKELRLFDMYEPNLLHKVVFRFIEHLGSVSKFKLTKLLYMLDWKEVQTNGNVLTGCYYIFQKDGPLATGLSHVLEEMEGYEISFRFHNRLPTYFLGANVRSDMHLPIEVKQKIDYILQQYGPMNEKEIKTRTYLTKPVKQILHRQRQGERVLNYPVFEGFIRHNNAR